MADQELLNALNDCVDRLAAGYSIEECLAAYPQQAAALRTMLETGRLVHRARVNMMEVAQAQERMRFRVQGRFRQQTRRAPLMLRAVGSAVLLVVLLLGSVLFWGMMRARDDIASPLEKTAIPTATTFPTLTMATITPTLTPTATATGEVSLTPTVTASSTPTIRTVPRITRTPRPGTSGLPINTPLPQPGATDDHGGDNKNGTGDNSGSDDNSGSGGNSGSGKSGNGGK
jgi:uncharacterized membrane protein YgcG